MNQNTKQHTIDLIFPLLFILLFCLCAMLVILCGTKIYRKTAEGLSENYTLRTALPYLQEKIRECGAADHIEILNKGDNVVLALYQETEGVAYGDYIYLDQGTLKELFTKKTEEPAYEAGQDLVTLDSFYAEWKDEGMLYLRIACGDQEETCYMRVLNAGDQ